MVLKVVVAGGEEDGTIGGGLAAEATRESAHQPPPEPRASKTQTMLLPRLDRIRSGLCTPLRTNALESRDPNNVPTLRVTALCQQIGATRSNLRRPLFGDV